MFPTQRVLLAALLVTVPLTGCLGGDDVPAARAVSTQGQAAIADGWAYDGVGLARSTATLEGSVNDPDNVGGFNVSFQYAGSEWRVTFDQFSGQESYKDGGVAFSLREHGATGVADASIPGILALVAAWGSATVQRDGAPYADPGTGQTGPWVAHLMVSDTTVRGSDGRITKADGSTPYDPNAPDDARTVAGDVQVLFYIRAPSGADAHRAPVNASETFTFEGPEATQTAELATGPWGSGTVNVTTAHVMSPLGAGELTVRLLDADGNELDAATATVTPAETPTLSFPLNNVAGPVTVELTGQGAFIATVNASYVFDDHAFVTLTWDEATVEPA